MVSVCWSDLEVSDVWFCLHLLLQHFFLGVGNLPVLVE